jgi:hypothetical protein
MGVKFKHSQFITQLYFRILILAFKQDILRLVQNASKVSTRTSELINIHAQALAKYKFAGSGQALCTGYHHQCTVTHQPFKIMP